MIYDNLLAIAAKAPASSGLRQGEQFLSYAALVERIARLAAGFADRGIGRGDVVALLIPNSPEIFVVAHALFAIGAIAMPLGTTATRAELASLAAKSGLAAIVAAPAHKTAAESLIADVAPAAALFLTSALADLEIAVTTPLPNLSGQTTALYLSSSGSTGLPKIVPHTHAELIADGVRTSTTWDLQPEDVVLNILPSNFAVGFLLGTMNAVARGATTLYWSDSLPLALSRKKLLDAMVAHRVSFTGAVPAMYEILAAQGGAFDLSALRLAFSGGAALKRPIFEAMRARFGITLRQAYGSTEAIMVSHNTSADPDASWASVGRPAGDAEVRIAPYETELGPDVGELLVRSSSLMQGYLGEPAANAQAFDDGWFRTGDLASLDDEGRLFIRGRSKLLIEVSGYKIDPIEVEETLAAHPLVEDAAVIGVPDTRSGNRLRAYVVRTADVSEDELIRHARGKLSVQKVPAEIAFLEALPKSPTGKLLRGKLREL
ncbi:MAG: acyl--CoA ligase [Devosia nanyangense]|uniref:Acyl--CoA ligase n=1 Tax=Devosia nanyangense TaxID=1228055 RepID=A0A933L404_9HYPH|nr:acyl--CoA ligase [Devosia nanyangense]